MTPADLLRLPRPLILASRSPRRAELLRLLGIPFRVYPAQLDEPSGSTTQPPTEYVLSLARAKALTVARLCAEPCLIIGADTTVVADDTCWGKPATAEDARTLLERLSGRTHDVYTGVVLLRVPEMELSGGVARTEVTFRPLRSTEIDAYIATGSPLDKAGGYGIQDPFGAIFVESVRGCYYNVVGLPLSLVYELLRQACDAEQ
ncbi:MAG: Maf family protein [Candidatus Kapabacteria bacterium]|nr:Maf family protein [Candidatus Kapabacteria bacterium]MDW8224632.1 Maf family protein [Bacteroidota bacterium]